MHLLLDTHILIWAIDEPDRLSAEFRAAIENPGNRIYFSVMSILEISIKEISIKTALRRADFVMRPERALELASQSGFEELPLSSAVACTVGDLPLHHRDPFDRLLVAQALAEPVRLMTSDAIMQRYSQLVWLQGA